jgi:hypothetical protein
MNFALSQSASATTLPAPYTSAIGGVDINYRATEAYITKRREEKKSNATINRELELLNGRRRRRELGDPDAR